jgi:hypothetical protein
MRMRFLLLLAPAALALAYPRLGEYARAASGLRHFGGGSITALSDEFSNPATLPNWRHAYKDEGFTANQLERFDINKTQPGWMTMVPYSSGWYKDYHGILAYKPIEGDFVMTTHLRVSSRNGSGPPRAQYSLAGIMIRAPRPDTAQTWQPGRENYVFLSTGAADKPGTYQFEVKTTTNSDSQLRISPAYSGETMLQVARIGGALILLKNVGGQWTVHARYWRPDFPSKLQAGLTCYSDWPTVSRHSPQQHNNTVLRGTPDLRVSYDFVRYRRPQVPANLVGKALADPRAVSDADLLRFLGNAAAK